jgi:hypothetical protein
MNQHPGTGRTLSGGGWGMVFLVLLACCMFIIPVQSVLDRWDVSRGFPYQLDIEEGFIFNQAVLIARGESIYQPIDSPPWLVGNYPPLFPALFALVNGDHIGFLSLPAGRILVQVIVLICLLILGLTVGLHTWRLDLALLSMGLFMATYELNQWSAFVRVDFAALMFTLAGLAVFLRVGHWIGLVISSLLFTCAIFTKQTAVLAPLACLISLLISERRHVLWFILPGLVVSLLLSCFFHASTEGEFFRHLVVYNQNEMEWGKLQALLKNEVWYFFRWWICAMAILVVVGIVRHISRQRRTIGRQSAQDKPGQDRYDIPYTRYVCDIYLGLAVLSILLMAKSGSSTNYLLEPLAAAALWTGVALGKSSTVFRRDSGSGLRMLAPRLVIYGTVLLIGLHAAALSIDLSTIHQTSWLQRRWIANLSRLDAFRDSTQPRGDHARLPADELNHLLRKAHGGIFSEEPVFTMLARREVLHQPFIMKQLAEEGKWDQAPFLRMIREGGFEYFVVTDDLREVRDSYMHYTAEMGEAVRESFSHQGTFNVSGFRRLWHLWKFKTD